jgi:hypothetical protein
VYLVPIVASEKCRHKPTKKPQELKKMLYSAYSYEELAKERSITDG